MKRIALTLIASAVSSLTMAATPQTGQEILQQFNLVTLGNVTSYSHVDGRSYIGGSVSGGDYAQHPEKTAASAYAGLTVAGSASGVHVNGNGAAILGNLSNSTVNSGSAAVLGSVTNSSFSGGPAYVAGNSSASTFNNGGTILGNATDSYLNGSTPSFVGGNSSGSTLNSGGTIMGNATNSNINGSQAFVGGSVSGSGNFNATRLAAPVVVAAAPPSTVAAATSTDFKSTLTGLSSSLSKLANTSSWSTVNGKTTFNAVANANGNGIAVFDLTSADTNLFKNSSEFSFNYNGAKTVIINVDDADVTINATFIAPNGTNNDAMTAGTNTIWNFSKTTTKLTINSQFGGTILATSAALTNNANIEGSVLVGSLTQNAEIHSNNFKGDITSVSAVPEPESYALMLGGLALMTLVARRRRA